MSLLHALHNAHQKGAELFIANLHGKDVTIRQTVVLTALRATPDVSQTSLVRATGIDRSTLADIVRRMKTKGWIARHRTKEDQRAYAVKLTESGRQMQAAALAALNKTERMILADNPKLKGLAD